VWSAIKEEYGSKLFENKVLRIYIPTANEKEDREKEN
jgi:hypothetical protein